GSDRVRDSVRGRAFCLGESRSSGPAREMPIGAPGFTVADRGTSRCLLLLKEGSRLIGRRSRSSSGPRACSVRVPPAGNPARVGGRSPRRPNALLRRKRSPPKEGALGGWCPMGPLGDPRELEIALDRAVPRG